MLLVIDLQIGLASPDYGARSRAPVVANVEALLHCWRRFALPVAFTQHLSSCEVVHDVALAALRASGIAVRTTREQIDLAEALP